MGMEIPLAGLALAAVGTGLSVKASMDDKNAMEQKTNEALQAQAGYQKRATAAYATSVNQSTLGSSMSQIAQGTQKTADAYTQAQSQPTGLTPSASVDPVTAARTQAVIGQSNSARSALSGYNNWSLAQNLKDMLAKEQISVINGESQARAGVLPLQLQQASHTGDELALAGTGLSTLGSLAGLYGVYGALPSLGTAAAGAAVGSGDSSQPFH